MIVLGSKTGDILVAYLGTNPSLFSVTPTLARDINYEETDRELAVLTEKIKIAQSDSQ